MNTKKFSISILIVLLIFVSFTGFAQEETEEPKSKVTLTAGVDIVSSYVWRGLMFDAAPNIQPTFDINCGNIGGGFWGSSNFTGTYLEPDFYIYFAKGNFVLTFMDFHAGGVDYFNYKADETMHVDELFATYTISENFPLTIMASVFVYGADKKLDDPEKNNYSSYLELNYNFTVNNGNIDVFMGACPMESGFYGTDGFGIVNLGIKGTAPVKISESFTLPINIQFITNPDAELAYLVAGIKLNL